MCKNTIRVIKLIPFGAFPCFALPVLGHGGQHSPFSVQEIDPRNDTVMGFKEILIESSHPMEVDNGPEVSIGDRQIYAFIDSTGRSVVGNLASLKPILCHELDNGELDPTLILQIAELIGSSEQKNLARTRMFEKLRDLDNLDSAQNFIYKSVQRAAYWDKFFTSATNALDSKRLLKIFSRIDFRNKKYSENKYADFFLDTFESKPIVSSEIQDLVSEIDDSEAALLAQAASDIRDDPLGFAIRARAKTTFDDQMVAYLLKLMEAKKEIGGAKKYKIKVERFSAAVISEIAIIHHLIKIKSDSGRRILQNSVANEEKCLKWLTSNFGVQKLSAFPLRILIIMARDFGACPTGACRLIVEFFREMEYCHTINADGNTIMLDQIVLWENFAQWLDTVWLLHKLGLKTKIVPVSAQS